MKRDFSRRDLLIASSCILVASFLAACFWKNSSPPLVLNSPLDDTPVVFMNTYYGAVGSSPPTPQNPKGIHQGMDFVAPTGTPVKAVASGTITRITTEIKTEPDGTINTYANVFLAIGGKNTIIYIFEPLQNLFVVEGQVVATGDIIGTLAATTAARTCGARREPARSTLGLCRLSTAIISESALFLTQVPPSRLSWKHGSHARTRLQPNIRGRACVTTIILKYPRSCHSNIYQFFYVKILYSYQSEDGMISEKTV